MTISGKARLAGVLGWPVAQSRSPMIHNHWISTLGLEAAYVPLPVQPQHFEAVLRAMPRMGFVGANVTVPHKVAAAKLCDTLDDEAKLIGAVNTLVFKDDGRIEGRNTDAEGFSKSLIAQAGDEQMDRACVVVLGAGGAGRAVVAALVKMGCGGIRVANRSRDKADALVADFAAPKSKLEAIDWEKRDDGLDSATMVVNTTTLGMTGQPPLELDLAPLSRGAIVADIVYSPLETPLLAAARELGFATVGGLRMLVEQARPAFEAWFGTKPGVTRELMEMLEADVTAKER